MQRYIPNFDVLVRTERLLYVLAGDPHRAQAMKNRLVEPSNRRELGLNMEWFVVSAQPVQCSLRGASLLLEYSVRVPLRGCVRSGGGAPV